MYTMCSQCFAIRQNQVVSAHDDKKDTEVSKQSVFKWLSEGSIESYCAIAIATLSDWLKNLAPVFKRMSSEGKPMVSCELDFSCTLSKLLVIDKNSDWFLVLFAPFVIGRGN